MSLATYCNSMQQTLLGTLKLTCSVATKRNTNLDVQKPHFLPREWKVRISGVPDYTRKIKTVTNIEMCFQSETDVWF
jgi:hypothetical protein